MKLKNISWIAGAIALTLSVTPPYAVQAQTTPPTTQPPVIETQKKGPWEKLGLTDAQKDQIKTIHRATRAQFEAILTPEQLAKLNAERQAGKQEKGRRRLDTLNLTDEQKSQIQTLWKSRESQIEAILTPDQLAELKKLREAHHQKNPSNP